MGPAGRSYGAGAVATAASGIADYGLFGIGLSCAVTVVRLLATAAGMLGRDCGLQRGRKNRSDQHKKQQNSCGLTLH